MLFFLAIYGKTGNSMEKQVINYNYLEKWVSLYFWKNGYLSRKTGN